MRTIYINGIEADLDDLEALFENIRRGKEHIIGIRTTKSNNTTFVTTA